MIGCILVIAINLYIFIHSMYILHLIVDVIPTFETPIYIVK